jgi:hypothetical protein
MIGPEILNGYHAWFDGYVLRFESRDPELQANLELKAEHSRNVCAEITALGRTLGLDGPA